MKPFLQVLAICTLALACACGGPKSAIEKPGKAGTAEQLVGTTWRTSGGTLTFVSGSALQFIPKGGDSSSMPVPTEPLTGNYSVAEGILRASVANTMPFAGTWDGERLTIGGEECTRVTTP